MSTSVTTKKFSTQLGKKVNSEKFPSFEVIEDETAKRNEMTEDFDILAKAFEEVQASNVLSDIEFVSLFPICNISAWVDIFNDTLLAIIRIGNHSTVLIKHREGGQKLFAKHDLYHSDRAELLF